jgi:hypothetical protein
VSTIKAEEPWAILTIEKHKVSLLTDTRVSISAIHFSRGPRFSKTITVLGVSGQPLQYYFTHSAFSLFLGRFPLLPLIFNCPRNPYSSARERPFI